MGITVIGGLLLSTVLTLVIVPATFSLAVALESWFAGTLVCGRRDRISDRADSGADRLDDDCRGGGGNCGDGGAGHSRP